MYVLVDYKLQPVIGTGKCMLVGLLVAMTLSHLKSTCIANRGYTHASRGWAAKVPDFQI